MRKWRFIVEITVFGVNVNFNYGNTTPANQMKENTAYLDGAVQGPVIDNERRSYSFDHHANCVRAFTLATCQQVAQAIELGWDVRGLEVVVNDLDADTMVSVWIILHPERVREDRVQELVNRVGFVDAHGPAIPGRTPHPLHFALTPRFGQEQTGELFHNFLGVLDNWFETGKEPSAREDRPAPAFGLTADGELLDLGPVKGFEEVYKTCVVGVVEVPGSVGTIGYTIGKVSDFVSYDIKSFLARCNEIESGWGGGSTVGGAPRLEGGKRSSLSRSQVEEILLAGARKR